MIQAAFADTTAIEATASTWTDGTAVDGSASWAGAIVEETEDDREAAGSEKVEQEKLRNQHKMVIDSILENKVQIGP